MKFPEAFVTYTRGLMGNELYSCLEQALASSPPISIRLNPFKTACFDMDIDYEPVGWCDQGVYLKDRPNFTFDPLLHCGAYYVQEASSMFVAHVIRQLVRSPVHMLDLCAAPGGKSTCAMSALPPGSVLFSNEPMQVRARILTENIQKFGHPDIYVTNNYARDYQKTRLKFDVILADVPCSGEGMFRKDENAIEEWSPANVEKCARLQREIVSDIWPCLNDGGYLIYSTCTFNAHENEENVNRIAQKLGADFVSIPTKPEWNITGSLTDNHPMYRFIPGKTRGEGLFLAVLRKRGTAEEVFPTPDKPLSAWKEKDLEGLRVLTHGINAPQQKGKDLMPDISMALSILPDKDRYTAVDIDYPTAIAYLRREAITLSPQAPRGIILITYQGQPLGFAKNIGNRANNLFPQEWKIKSSHLQPLIPILKIKS
ncbi:hypothetical protein JHU38_06765 [Prevotella sp. A2931]|uniref:SAM-dependent MTase RsmB/NOP-type domain-containing protein n=1 Tax=Prevotella illustrans TaxID=2800387 RepID=A0ABS3M5L6_9BACT|nr:MULTISPECIES: hypothetical protein [Prevotella]MBO1363474.1 hypothetical protein [Prevotella illustrans]PTL26077.1 hypothetical protein C3V39_02755 [Prevotella sp. oral taxon 820]